MTDDERCRIALVFGEEAFRCSLIEGHAGWHRSIRGGGLSTIWPQITEAHAPEVVAPPPPPPKPSAEPKPQRTPPPKSSWEPPWASHYRYHWFDKEFEWSEAHRPSETEWHLDPHHYGIPDEPTLWWETDVPSGWSPEEVLTPVEQLVTRRTRKLWELHD